jgi:hypothetical protein
MELVEKKAVGASVVEVHGKLIGTPDNCDAMHRLFKSLLDNGQSKIVVDLGNTPWAKLAISAGTWSLPTYPTESTMYSRSQS